MTEIITRRYIKVCLATAHSWTSSGGGQEHDSLDEAMATLREWVEQGHQKVDITVVERQLP